MGNTIEIERRATSTTSRSSAVCPRTRSAPTGAISARYRRFLEARDITEPGQVDEATVRPFLAALSASTYGEDERPYRATSVARSLSSVRSFHRFLVREGVTARSGRGRRAAEAAALAATPLTVDEVDRLMDAPDRGTPTGLRDRAILEPCTARGCACRSSPGSMWTTSTSRAARCGCSARAARSGGAAGPIRPRGRRRVPHSGASLARSRRGPGRVVPEPARRAPVPAELRPHGPRGGPGRGYRPARLPAHPPSFLATHLLEGGADACRAGNAGT